MTLEERILGSLLGGAIGDAMGAATETRTPELIREKFGGYVREFRQAPEDTFARGAVAGYVTDDFSLAYYTAREIVKNGGKIDRGVAERSVLTWSEHPEYFDNYAGPTTRAGIARLKGETPAEGYSFLACDNAKATNGAGMKIGPVGMLHPGDLDRAVADAVTIIRVTHDNDLAISGGCAIAAAVSCAMVEGRNAVDIVNAGLYGAREGMRLARGFAKKLAGPSVEKRISLAAEIGLRHCGDYERAMLELGDVVGAGLHVSEAVPCVFGLVMSTNGHPLETIFSAVNIGNDTDTVAAMAGYIVGALNGAPAYDSYYYDTIEAANHFDLRSLAHEMAACAARN
ncbi:MULTISPECIES: ADP-ribosylglycohydrolase family protein [Anaerotruncus]|uniref:ADP-ribosylglycohydrolase n=2 Tax=Anaerotruncus TaxID=244127 RepID=A0A498CNW1_9FIRM|nr:MULTISPECIES: ADP-ribosylglycohydrolase family protein [Anaerotruncus]MBC3939306.1 ADP-ribosylglycohydrolase family protein [Anaerotruncus massiliensis (ex Togo et al. 2019)]RLL09613.1 hypothetical protein D4A47_10205 [Anaerotruncus massiliensis (ex Liu et al. 2021)]GKH48879.1 ADP-ribosylglycohydrolase [Oscillospiraceae bacterium]